MKLYHIVYSAASGNIDDIFDLFVECDNAIEALYVLMLYELGARLDDIPLPDPAEIESLEQLNQMLVKMYLSDEFYDSIFGGGDWVYFDAQIEPFVCDPLDFPYRYNFSISDRDLYSKTHKELIEFIQSNRSGPEIVYRSQIPKDILEEARKYVESVRQQLEGVRT